MSLLRRLAGLTAIGQAIEAVGTGDVAPGPLRPGGERRAAVTVTVALTPVTDRDAGADPYVFGPPGATVPVAPQDGN